MSYFVYVKNLVGIKTDYERFKWSFGANAPRESRECFDACRVKIFLDVVPDKEVFRGFDHSGNIGQFSYFTVTSDGSTICYHRSFKHIPLNYRITIKENEVHACVGKSYMRLIKVKIMNIHPIGYVLFDIVTSLLLRSGYAPVYGSSFSSGGKGALIMAPPRMGKTLTVIRLVQDSGAKMLGEDIAVTDGEKIYAVPLTDTYRDYGKTARAQDGMLFVTEESASLDRVFLLEKGKRGIEKECDPYKKISLLNRHGIGYYYSPALTALSYYNSSFSMEELISRERKILSRIVANVEVFTVSCDNAADYAPLIAELSH